MMHEATALRDTIDYKLGKLAGLYEAKELIDQYAKDTFKDREAAYTRARRDDADAEYGAIRETERLVSCLIKAVLDNINEGLIHATHE